MSLCSAKRLSRKGRKAGGDRALSPGARFFFRLPTLCGFWGQGGWGVLGEGGRSFRQSVPIGLRLGRSALGGQAGPFFGLGRISRGGGKGCPRRFASRR
jgi:hypothetical protein